MTQWNGVSFRDNLAHDAPRSLSEYSFLETKNATQ